MKDFKAIFNTYSGKMKDGLGFKTELGKKFKEGGFEEDHEDYYLRMFFSKLSAMKNFQEFLSTIKFDSVLEIGCSTGLLPLIFSDIFSKKHYTGIDLSQKSLDIAKKNLPYGEFICDDFIKTQKIKSHDLVISFDVIDHVYNPDLFLSKIIKSTKKFGYIRSYRGFFPTLENHKMHYRSNEGIYLNDLSISQIEQVCLKNNLSKNEFQIYKQLPRDKILYDSDLGRAWKTSNEESKIHLLNKTGFSKEEFDKLPINLEDSTVMLEKSKTTITPKLLGLSDSYNEHITKPSTIIKILKSDNTL
jgi:SAM-dependent methyltransferase